MSILLLILACGFIALLEAPRLLKAKSYKDLSVFIVLLLFSFTLALLQILEVPLPNPYKGINYIVKQMTSIRLTE